MFWFVVFILGFVCIGLAMKGSQVEEADESPRQIVINLEDRPTLGEAHQKAWLSRSFHFDDHGERTF